MIRDENVPIDDTFLAALLAADAALAEGRYPLPDRSPEEGATRGQASVEEFVQLLRGVGHRGMPARTEADDTVPGAVRVRLGRCEILGTLGQGGVGIVDRA